ncbi:MAG TPA: cyclodeaminase/cyclohydrolase family protein, partial [Blastocatellia bacterium]|nr:cyclodeaminase/cyclohydrolase family protein [Blastocatellia bacterium]
ELRDILSGLEQVSIDLRQAVDEDTESLTRVIAAEKLPHQSEAERLARTSAIEQAMKSAVAVPMRVAEGALQALELLDELSAIETAERFAEIPAGAQLALAAMRAAFYKSLVGLNKLGDAEFTRHQRIEIEEMIARGQELADEIESLFLSRQTRRE